MSKTPFEDSRGVVRCPICGNSSIFLVLTITVHIRPVCQLGARRWKANRPTPKQFEPLVPLLMICESCSHPIGAPTKEQLHRLSGTCRKPGRKH